MQVLTYNSPFKDKLNFIDDEDNSSSMWFSTWPLECADKPRTRHNFILEDYDVIVNSKSNFARKFAGEDGVELIKRIKKHIETKTD